MANGMMWLTEYDATTERRERSKYASEKAISLDPHHASAKILLALKLQRDGEWLTAFDVMEEALRLAPSSSYVAAIHANQLAMSGRLDEAVAEQSRAIMLDPLNAYEIYIYGLYLQFIGDFDGAIREILRAIEMGADISWANTDLSWTYYHACREDDAIQVMLSRVPDEGDRELVMQAYEEGGFVGFSRLALEYREETQGDACGRPIWGSASNDALAQMRDTMFRCLEMAVEQKRVLLLLGHWHFRRYRDDPRFWKILQMMGLDQVVPNKDFIRPGKSL